MKNLINYLIWTAFFVVYLLGSSIKAQTNASNKSSVSGLIITLSSTDQNCGTKPDGTASANVTGGTPPYSYYWNTGETTANISGLYGGGTYQVTVVDSLCNHDTASVTPHLINPVYMDGGAYQVHASCGTGACDGKIFMQMYGPGPFSYLWYPGGATTDSITNLCVGTSYTVTVTDSTTGCSQSFPDSPLGSGIGVPGPDPMMVSTNNVEYEQFPQFFFITYTYGCNGVINFTPDYYAGTPCYPATWLWDFGDNTTDTLESPTHTYSSPGSYLVKLIFNNGYPATYFVYINDTVANFKASITCGSTDVSFYYSSSGCPNTFLWDFGDPASGILNTDTLSYVSHTFSSMGTYTVSLIIDQTDTVIKTIVLDTIAVPHAAISISGGFPCGNDASFGINYNYDSLYCIKSFLWNFGDTASGANNFDTINHDRTQHTFSGLGTYTVSSFVSYYGGHIDTLKKAVTIITGFSINLGNDTVVSGDSLLLNAGVSNKLYSWYSYSIDSVIATTQYIMLKESGYYRLTVKDYDSIGCGYSSDVILVVLCQQTPNGISELSGITSSIYPNPFTENTTLQMSEYIPGSTLVITDLLGKEIKKLPLFSTTETIYTDGLPPGMYFYQILTKEKRISEGKLLIR